jgi:hypothetical protein
MTAHAAIAAVPKTGTPNRTLLQSLLVTRVAYVLGDAEDPQAFDPRGEDGSPLTLVIGYQGQWFWFDEDDATTAHDGTTCIVTTATGGRYKIFGTDLLVQWVISKTEMDPPDPDDPTPALRPSNGDAYLVPTGGTWPSGKEDYIAVWVQSRREWFYIAPKKGWTVWIPGDSQDTAYHYDSVQNEWLTGLGGGIAAADSVAISSIIGFGATAILRAENQTTYAPPGSRQTTATPAAPLGGTASNLNDDDDDTTTVTSALGNLTGLPVGSRIIAQLTLNAATDLIAIEARGVLGSTTSTALAMGLYYSTDSGANWTQAGAGFTLSASAQNVTRTGDFQDVTDIAVVTEAKAWTSNTNTVAGLNAYDATVTGTIGDVYVIANGAFGIWAGQETKVAICEATDTYTIYTPLAGDELYDKEEESKYRWNGTAWVSASGVIEINILQLTASGNYSKPDRLIGVIVICIGAGGGSASTNGGGTGTSGGTTSFGSPTKLSATGGSGGSSTAGGAPGSGSGGTINRDGQNGGFWASGVATDCRNARPLAPFGTDRGYGGRGTAHGSNGIGDGGAGGGSEEWFLESALLATEAYTVGTGGGNGSGGTFESGGGGEIIIYEFLEQ